MKKQLPVTLSPLEKTAGWIYWALQLFVVPLALVLGNMLLPRPLSEARLNFVFFALNFLVVTVLLRKFLLSSCKHGLERPWNTLRSAVYGLGVYYLASLILSMVITWLKPDFANLNDDSIAGLLQQEYALTALGTVVLVPVVEETFYRGLLFGGLYARSPVLAYLVSGLVFAAIHLAGYLTEYDPLTLLLCFLQYFPAGLCLSWAYVRSGSILAPILMHMAINQIAVSTMR